MNVRTKLLLVLASVVLLVAAQEWMNLRFALRTGADVGQLEKNAVAESSAAMGMLDAISELETCLAITDNRESGPAHPLQIRNQGERAFQKFHRSLNDAGPGQPATLKYIEVTLGTIERKWQDYVNCLETSPKQARSIREHYLLPGLNDKLRPALANYCRGWADESTHQIQRELQRSQYPRQIMLVLMVLEVLAVLAAGFLLAKLKQAPVEPPAGTATSENRRDRLQPQSSGEWGDMAGVANPLSDVSPCPAISRDELEKTIQEHTQKMECEIAARHAAEAELRESERRHLLLLANLQGMVYRSRNDREWTMEFVSEGCRNLLGVEPKDFTTGHLLYSLLIHPEDQERVWKEVQSAIAKQGAFTLEYRVKHANGQWRSVWEQGRAVVDSRGQVIALEGYIMDLTQQVDAERECQVLEDQLRQAQKMVAIGTLAGGIAHDFNNLLAAILGSAELIKTDMAPGHPSREFLDQIFTAGRRAREVVHQILTFSQQRENGPIVMYLQPLVKECVKLLRSAIPAMVEISCQVDPDCPPVLADPAQIQQVITNLCTHAWQALPENSGRIRVTLEMCNLDQTMTASHPEFPAGPAVRLSISDNGRGMDQATLERIVEPISTPTAVGKGGGLGLTAVPGIVKAHQGFITVESEPGKGTAFHIYLPPQTIEENKEIETPAESAPIFSKNHERIMFVDDDESAGVATEMLLNRLGYQVRRFKLPEEALAHFQACPAEYDLVISDLAMPVMTGDNLAAALLRIRSDIPILITTGVIEPDMLKKAGEIGVSNVLLKPVSATTLASEIAQQLAHRGKH
jgi:signal transduction histidine kinase/CheY-like chemotaxis protein